MLSLALVVSALFATAPVTQQPVPPALQIEAGRASLSRGDYATAESTFLNAAKLAREAGDTQTEARAFFYVGLTKQEQAERTPAQAEQLRIGAIEAYRASLQLNPKLGGTMHNLAEIFISLEEYEMARELLQRALDLNDSRKSLYASKLAQLDSVTGTNDAERYWRIVYDDPNASVSQRKLVVEYLERSKKEEELVAYLWKSVGMQQSDFALSSALSAIENKRVDGDELEAMWAIAATALAQKNFDQAQLIAANISQRLIVLSDEPRSDQFAQSIVDLYAGAFRDAGNFGHWKASLDQEDIPKDLSPRNAIRDLMRSIARRAHAARDWDRAKDYYVMAQELSPEGDPKSILDLASLYYAQKNVEALDQLLRNYDQALYGAKAIAIASGSLDELYEFHRSLGTMYAWVKRPPDPKRPFASARYHLERAIDAAAQLSAERQREGKPAFEVDPGVKKLLADAYDAEGLTAKSLALRLDAADSYAKQGDLVAVRDVVAAIQYSSLETPEQKQRYAALVAPAVTFADPQDDQMTAIPADALKGNLIVLSNGKDKAARAAAERQLRELGVMHVRIEQGKGSLLLTSAKRRVDFELANNLEIK